MTPFTSAESIQYPSQEVVIKIGQLPKFDADVSAFVNDTPAQIADWADRLGKKAVLNISNATDAERAKFGKANELLRQAGGNGITLFDEKAKVSEITRQISDETIAAAQCFRAFIEDVLNEPELAVTEYNTFTTRDPDITFESLHYWGNIGLEDQNDPLRVAVVELIDDTIAKYKEGLEKKIIPGLREHPKIREIIERTRALFLGMFSNMVRGHFYKHASPDKVYGLRAMAVEAAERALKG